MSRRRDASPIARVMLSGAAVLMSAGLAGCTLLAGNEPMEPEELEGLAIGANAELAGVDVRSIVLISRDAGEPGRMLGTLVSGAEEPVELTFADEDDSVSVTLPPGDLLKLEEREIVIDSVEQRPGSYVPISVSAGGEEVEVQVPVFDGDLEYYAPYVPSE
jgi:hypothetical protein